MADASVPRGSADPGWGPATSVRSAAADAPPAPRAARTNGHNAEWDSAFYPQPSTPRASARERLEATGPAQP